MPLPRNYYDADILVDGELVEVRRFALVHGDELRAELEASKRGLSIQLALNLTSLQLWAALVRLGHYQDRYDAFKAGDLVEYRRVPADELTPEEPATVDPTPEAAPTGPASPSLPTSPASSTGSTPTSTTA